ncbi:MAG: DUF6600 domain-containing protein [Candidatus Deferrimicrobiaceae bacterium]
MALLASVIITLPSVAEEANTDSPGISAYSVARLKVFEGSVWVRTADSGDWEEYLHNSPVAEKSRISVPEGSEAELQFHGGQFMLLTEGTEIDVQEMRESKTEFRLRYGDIKFYLPEADFSAVLLSVPNQGNIDFPVPGQYWVTAGEGSDSKLVVRSGEATVGVESGQFPVNTGEEASIGRSVQVSKYSGDAGGGYEPPAPLTEEEEKAKIPPAAAYELREYGEWVDTPEYGSVWRPRVSPGWSPYYYGRWTWVSPYGWTWIAYEPWGWYPYHYGYWYNNATFGWVWYPYNSFISFGFVIGNYHGYHYHRNAYYHSSNARFYRNGRNVRWVPLSPGERRGSARFTRADKRLTRWNRPLREGSVYVRREGKGGREWRDVSVVQREQQRNRVSSTDARRERGRVQERATRPKSVEGSGRGRETRRLEGGKVPSVRTESGRSSPAREFRTRETRPGNTGRPAQPRLRNETPSRSRGRTSSGGSRGTFSQITRGGEQAGGGDRGSIRSGNVSETGGNDSVRGRSGNRGNGAVSSPGRRSGGGSTGGGVSRPGGTRGGGSGVSRPSGARTSKGSGNIRRTGGRSGSSSVSRSGARSGSVSRPSGANRVSANIQRTSGRSGSGSLSRSVGRSGGRSMSGSVGGSRGGSFGRGGGGGRGRR